MQQRPQGVHVSGALVAQSFPAAPHLLNHTP
jgi:hypothetical protein